MIRIDHLSIDIVAPDEDFPNMLYANWDNFCRDCIEHIIDEYFSPYDKDKVLCEIEEIDLDLGNIPEENFYEEFPQRLGEELIKKVSVGYSCPTDTLRTLPSRLDNLLFYLVHGYCEIEWTDLVAGLFDELDWLEKQPDSFVHLAVEKIASLCLSNEIALYRLLLQSGNHSFLQVIYSAMLAPSVGNREQKFHALVMFLEVRPLVVAQFVRETSDTASLHTMVELLDSLSVWTIMRTEYEGQVDFEILNDWHLLYDWLVMYYSYFDQSVSSSKKEFVCHLNQCLLTFIRKRNELSYVSSIELVRSFLLQVYGVSLYEKVLDVIEQRRLSSLQKSLSLTDSFYNVGSFHKVDSFHKLEQIFHDLYMNEIAVRNLISNDVTTHESLLGELSEQGYQESEEAVTATNIAENVRALFTSLWASSEGFSSWMVDSSISIGDKQNMIQIAVVQFMKQWISLLGTLKQNEQALEWIVSVLPVSVLQRGLSRMNLIHTSILIDSINRCDMYEGELLSAVHVEDRHKALSKAVLLYLQSEDILNTTPSTEEVVKKFLSYFFFVCTGKQDYHTEVQWYNLFCRLAANNEYGRYDEFKRSARGEILNESSKNELISHDLLSGNEVIRESELSECSELEHSSKKNYSDKKDSSYLNQLLNRVSALFEDRWNTSQGFVSWITDSSVLNEDKQKMIQMAVTHCMQQWLSLLKTLKQNEQALEWIVSVLPVSVLYQGMSRIHLTQFSVVAALVERMNSCEVGHYIDCNSISMYKAVSKASLLYLQHEDLSISSLPSEEVVDKFLSYLYGVYTGKADYHADSQWQNLHHWLSAEMKFEVSEYDKNSNSIDALMGENVSETVRMKILQRYVLEKPQELISFIRISVAQGKLPVDAWLQWLDSNSWIRLISCISLDKADLLNRTLKSLELVENDRRLALVDFLLKYSTDEWIYATSEETVRKFISTMGTLYQKCINKLEEIKQQTRSRLGLPLSDTIGIPDGTPNLLIVHHAGLCLLAPWFARLFSMLGYLNEERRDFKDVESKVRAIFLLQYLAYGNEGKYNEVELAFNRLLTALPEYIPLPQSLDLTAQEKETVDSMINGVKANWPNMSGTSVEGFRQSFIIRNGRLEQEDERWLLIVDDAAYDILLDNVPWGFRQIRFPWLRKYIQVKWHEEQMF